MKTLFSIALACLAAAALSACGGTKKNTAAATVPTRQEFDPNTGTWQPLTKVATPAPHEQGAVIVAQKKPGMLKKVGDNLKKPLKWIGLGKDETAAPAAPTAAAAQKPAPKP